MTGGNLQSVAGFCDRFAVIDLETTGLAPSDRVVEIAIVTVDFHGTIVDEWLTLLNPRGDVGPTNIHGITAADVRKAPTFEEVSYEVALRLDGSCLVAHNLFGFDAPMLNAEFVRMGRNDISLGTGLDTLPLTGANLKRSCEELGIPLNDWHSALYDARAVAAILGAVGHKHRSAVEPAALSGFTRPKKLNLRPRAAVNVSAPPDTPSAVAPPAASQAGDQNTYIEAVRAAISDMKIDRAELEQLNAAARAAQLDADARAAAHEHVVDTLIKQAIPEYTQTEPALSEAEFERLLAYGALLDLDEHHVADRTAAARSVRTTVKLVPKLTVCFTGDPLLNGERLTRDFFERYAAAIELDAQPSVTKSTKLLIADDIATTSGKARKARRYGIPITDAYTFLMTTPGDRCAATKVTVPERAVQRCPDCGITFALGADEQRRVGKKCPACVTAASTVLVNGTPTVLAANEEILECQACASQWVRAQARGRKPKLCPDCVARGVTLDAAPVATVPVEAPPSEPDAPAEPAAVQHVPEEAPPTTAMVEPEPVPVIQAEPKPETAPTPESVAPMPVAPEPVAPEPVATAPEAAPVAAEQALPNAAWHPDPLGRFQLRYWNGSQWTEHVSTNGQQAVDPMN